MSGGLHKGQVNQLGPSFQMTIKQLHKVYARFNKKWFDGRLPAQIAMSFEDMSHTCNAGLATTYEEPGIRIHSIHLDSKFQEYDKLLEFFLIHEMAHLAAYPNEKTPHDQAFQDQMHILAARGALKDLW